MIVEFVGCTGAGKTSLARGLERRGLPLEAGGLGSSVRMMYDLALDHGALRRITNPSLANIVQDGLALPFALATLHRRREFLLFARRTIRRRFPARVDRANRVRGVVRRIGMFELARTVADSDVVLSDEGTLLLAYLYALSDSDYSDSDLEMFASLAPLPDMVVYVRASTTALVERAARRSDRHRQLGGKGDLELERLITRTVRVFDRLVQTRPLAGRVLEIENSADGEAAQAGVVDALAARVWERRLELGQRPRTAAPAPGPA